MQLQIHQKHTFHRYFLAALILNILQFQCCNAADVGKNKESAKAHSWKNGDEFCESTLYIHRLEQLGASKYLYHTGTVEQAAQLSWEESRHYCQTSGFSMAIINNAKEFEQLEIELLQKASQQNNAATTFWIGAKTNNGSNKFIDGSTVKLYVESAAAANESEKCVLVQTNKYLTAAYLKAHNCSEKNWVLCEYSENKQKENCFSSPVGMENNRKSFENIQGTYMYHQSKKKSWNAALEFCRENGMQLLSIQTEEVDSFVYTSIKKQFPNAETIRLWTSGTFWFSPPPGFSQLSWMTTGEIANDALNVLWKSGEPSGNSQEKCVDVEYSRNSSSSTLQWQASNCDEVLEFLCRAPDPCHHFDDDESGFFFNIRDKKYFFSFARHTWMDALEYCTSNGMELLALETVGEDILVANHIQQLNFKNLIKNVTYWTSATDIGQRGNYMWLTTGRAVLDSSLRKMIPTSNKLYGNEHCIRVTVNGIEKDKKEIVQWEDADCSWSNNFVCEQRNDCTNW